jgi:hypothetical protein
MLAEDQVAVKNSHLVECLESLLLSLIPKLKRCLSIFTPEKFMLNWAHSDQLFDSVLLGQFGGLLDEGILIGCACKVIMGEIDHILGSLEGKVQADL